MPNAKCFTIKGSGKVICNSSKGAKKNYNDDKVIHSKRKGTWRPKDKDAVKPKPKPKATKPKAKSKLSRQMEEVKKWKAEKAKAEAKKSLKAIGESALRRTKKKAKAKAKADRLKIRRKIEKKAPDKSILWRKKATDIIEKYGFTIENLLPYKRSQLKKIYETGKLL